MKKLLAVACFSLLASGVSAQEETRQVIGFVGKSVQVFDENLKPVGQLSPAELTGVTSATKNGSTPFYRVEQDGKILMILGNKITFADRPKTDMIPCNTRESDFQGASFNSTMGSGEKKACSEVQ